VFLSAGGRIAPKSNFWHNWYAYGARFYDPALGRWHVQDRFAEKYFDFTPYQYGANNPIIFIDINGDSIYHFDENGYFTGEIIPDDGPQRGLFNGVEFIFGDQENDHTNLFSIKDYDEKEAETGNDYWYKVSIEDEKDVDERLEKGGVFDERGLISGIKYIFEETAGGKLDYGPKIKSADPGNHYIVQTSEGHTGFSARNYGNFLIGISHRKISKGLIGTGDTQILAHGYHLTHKGDGYFDSKDDQKAIKLGGDYYKKHYSKKKKRR